MNPKILRLLKAIFFASLLTEYGFLIKFSSHNNWWATFVFVIILWMYLREIKGVEDEN